MTSVLSRTLSLLAAVALALVGLTVATPVALAAPAPAEADGDHVLIGVLPDTQFHSRYATEETNNPYMRTYGSEPYAEQTRWLAESKEKYGTEFVIHLGDVVDQANHEQQWEVADRAMRNLEGAQLPYSILAGNHDVGDDFAQYRATFPESRVLEQPTRGGTDPSGLHSYQVVHHKDQEFLILALSWDADATAMEWAQDVMDAYPGVPTILTSHQLINISSDATHAEPTDFGEKVWNELIRHNDQVFLTLNGHHHGAMTWERKNDFGHPVHQVLIDHQMAYMGGNGILSMLDLDLTNNEISMTTLSPWVAVKPADTLQPLDTALLDGEHATFTVPFDFSTRFPNLKVSGDTVPSPTLAIRDWITHAVTTPEAAPKVAPANQDDYPHIDGTKAHWRPAGHEGTAPVGSVIPDIAGGNDFTRAPLNVAGAVGAEEGDVRFTNDGPTYSANPGAVCFDNADKTTGRASWFTTADDAAINSESFEDGFTMETFIRVDPSFSVDKNAWMTWLGRDGKRSEVPGYVGDEGDEPPMAWAFSSLNEIQFAFTDATSARTESSLWSGEIVNYTEWMHLVVTFDPDTQMATLYVDGVPMLRDAAGVNGLAHDAGLPWLLGAGTYGGTRDSGFVGCVGETRIVEGVLGQDQWLTSRAPEGSLPTDEPTHESTDEPTAEVPTERPKVASPTPQPTTPSSDPGNGGKQGPSSAEKDRVHSGETADDPASASSAGNGGVRREGAATSATSPSVPGPATRTTVGKPAADTNATRAGFLPRTGTDVAAFVAFAGGLLVVGGLITASRRVRR